MEIKDQIAIVLKEYDALRKEIDDRLNAPKLYFVPLLFVFLGGFLGWKAELPIDLALLFIFPAFLTFLSFAITAGYYVQRGGKQIAKIEDKVFRLSGLSLLTHESETLQQRKKLPVWGTLLLSAIIAAFYILIEVWLFDELDTTRLNQFAIFPGRQFILLSLVAIPLIIFLFTIIRMAYLQRSLRSFRSDLLDKLKANNQEHLIDSALKFDLDSDDFPSFRKAINAFERYYFKHLMTKYAGDKIEAAKHSGLSRSQFYEKVSGLEREEDA